MCFNSLFVALQDGQSRTIRQFQFTDWPEQGVPKTGEGFIDFIGQVHKTKEQFGQDGPITVHCRYGGRLGPSLRLWTIQKALQSFVQAHKSLLPEFCLCGSKILSAGSNCIKPLLFNMHQVQAIKIMVQIYRFPVIVCASIKGPVCRI